MRVKTKSKPASSTDAKKFVDWDALDALALQYRKENFAVEVAPAEHPVEDGELALSITHNGYQWQVITLLKEEAKRVVAALNAHHEV